MKKQLIGLALVVVYLTVMVLFGLDNITGYVSSSKCGNYVCETEESVATCPTDCVATCGDHICEAHERYTCVIDCKDARNVKIEQRAFHTGAIWMVFTASAAIMLIAIALLEQPGVRTRRRKKRRTSCKK